MRIAHFATLALGLALAGPAFANERGQSSSFQGDTMDRDGGPSGRSGAPQQAYVHPRGRNAQEIGAQARREDVDGDSGGRLGASSAPRHSSNGIG